MHLQAAGETANKQRSEISSPFELYKREGFPREKGGLSPSSNNAIAEQSDTKTRSPKIEQQGESVNVTLFAKFTRTETAGKDVQAAQQTSAIQVYGLRSSSPPSTRY